MEFNLHGIFPFKDLKGFLDFYRFMKDNGYGKHFGFVNTIFGSCSHGMDIGKAGFMNLEVNYDDIPTELKMVVGKVSRICKLELRVDDIEGSVGDVMEKLMRLKRECVEVMD